LLPPDFAISCGGGFQVYHRLVVAFMKSASLCFFPVPPPFLKISIHPCSRSTPLSSSYFLRDLLRTDLVGYADLFQSFPLLLSISIFPKAVDKTGQLPSPRSHVLVAVFFFFCLFPHRQPLSYPRSVSSVFRRFLKQDEPLFFAAHSWSREVSC